MYKYDLTCSSDWQYGQNFVNLGTSARQFWVEPFDPQQQPIACEDQMTYVFTRWLRLVDYRRSNGTVEKNSRTRINSWLSKRPWDEMVKKVDFFHIGKTPNPDDPLLGVTMEGRDSPGFRYRVTYNEGDWTCTCMHWHANQYECCKHINACIDVCRVATGEEKRLPWSMESQSYDVGLSLLHSYPGVNDVVEERFSTGVPTATTGTNNYNKIIATFVQYAKQ
tara:strand:- start:5886 stop:6551 length:666 start_codon:yes stop_codon:yes gene_type:complete